MGTCTLQNIIPQLRQTPVGPGTFITSSSMHLQRETVSLVRVHASHLSLKLEQVIRGSSRKSKDQFAFVRNAGLSWRGRHRCLEVCKVLVSEICLRHPNQDVVGRLVMLTPNSFTKNPPAEPGSLCVT